MLPTAAAAWAARGEGGSPAGSIRSHLPVRTSRTWTSLVAPANLMPAADSIGHRSDQDVFTLLATQEVTCQSSDKGVKWALP